MPEAAPERRGEGEGVTVADPFGDGGDAQGRGGEERGGVLQAEVGNAAHGRGPAFGAAAATEGFRMQTGFVGEEVQRPRPAGIAADQGPQRSQARARRGVEATPQQGVDEGEVGGDDAAIAGAMDLGMQAENGPAQGLTIIAGADGGLGQIEASPVGEHDPGHGPGFHRLIGMEDMGRLEVGLSGFEPGPFPPDQDPAVARDGHEDLGEVPVLAHEAEAGAGLGDAAQGDSVISQAGTGLGADQPFPGFHPDAVDLAKVPDQRHAASLARGSPRHWYCF